MRHLVLLGDSIFDNATYVPRQEAVIDHVRARLPRDWKATLLAIDGNVSLDVERQIEKLPSDATHLALSIGGNDALGASGILERDANSAMQVFREFTAVKREFETNYRRALRAVAAARLPFLICTIYDAMPGIPAEAISALSIFNDVIIREGIDARLPILDLRFVCSEQADYAAVSPIEPSARGGAKIAAALIRVIQEHPFGSANATIYR